MTTLLLCNSCQRHFRMHEAKCPFCGAVASGTFHGTRRGFSLSPGSSRSRRYAASAAFVAGGAMVACGGSTNATSGEKDGHGGYSPDAATGEGGIVTSAGGATGSGGRVSTGGRGSGGASAGGAGSGGRVSTGGAASGGISFGGTASGGVGGVGEARHPCPGATDPAPQQLCRTTSDCTNGVRPECVITPPMNNGCRFVPQDCTSDATCPSPTVCQTGACNAHTCSAACTATNCPVGTTCTGGHCVPTPCDSMGGACAAGYVCKPGDAAADPRGCVQAHCQRPADCPQGWDCVTSAPGLGCVHRACKVDGDCACGYCVNAVCEATLGYCYEIIAMPYGCVWPDEELV